MIFGLIDLIASIVLQPDGKILIGGNFTSYNGLNQNRLIRLNSDGSVDNSFSIGSGFDNAVSIISLLPNGKIMATGDFFNYNQSSARQQAVKDLF